MLSAMIRCSTQGLAGGVAFSALALLGGCDDMAGPLRDGALYDASAHVDAGSAPDIRPRADAIVQANPTVVVLPDTQFYAAAYPEIFQAQTGWIRDHRTSANLVAVLHEGDIVDTPSDQGQWQAASDAFANLDGVVPYFVLAGNHDEDRNRQGYMNQYFPITRFSQYGWFGGTFAPNNTENSYGQVTIGSTVWLVLALEFGPRDAVVAWADGVLKANAAMPAILVTHAYLYNDGTRYDVNKTPPQSFDPDTYNYTPLEGVNDGEQLWQKLVLGNENVKLVLSGHCLGDPANAIPAAARLTSARPSGSQVHQILANYQICADLYCCAQYPDLHGGNGYLRLLEFDDANRLLRVHTYSPYLDQYVQRDDSEDFTLAW
jgi:hypothetical protein